MARLPPPQRKAAGQPGVDGPAGWFLLQIRMAVRIVVVVALLVAFAYGFAKLAERYGRGGNQPSPCGEWSNPDCPVPAAPPLE